MKKRTLTFLKEYTALIVAIATFFISPYVLRWLDPTAAPYDAGVLQIMIYSVVSFAVFQAITWSIVKNIWPVVGTYFKELFNSEFLLLTPWQRQKVSLFVYFSILVLLVFLSRAIQ
jgi:hypothetical protein